MSLYILYECKYFWSFFEINFYLKKNKNITRNKNTTILYKQIYHTYCCLTVREKKTVFREDIDDINKK